MGFYKRVIVLKQIESGYSVSLSPISAIFRIEIEDGVSTLFLSAVNFRLFDNGEYYAFIVDGNKKVFSFNLGKRPTSFFKTFDDTPNIEKGFSGGICFIENDIPILVAFQRSEGINLSVYDFKKMIAEKCFIIHKSKTEKEHTVKPQEEQIQFNHDVYNDEAVATENYFAPDFKESTFSFNNDFLTDKGEYDDLRDKTSPDDLRLEEKEKESEKPSLFDKNETDYGDEEYGKDNPYYLTVIDELNSLFNKFPKEFTLQNMLPNSKWVKIFYDNNKYYVVGIVYDGDNMKYICYGIPSVYKNNPPKELDGYCTFVPISVFNMHGNGYYIMFQDAITGDCIKEEN